jgi:hypothetical protein
MTRDNLAAAIAAAIEAQMGDWYWGALWVGDYEPDGHILIDGHVDLLRVADAMLAPK